MRILYFDCFADVSGDMLLGALVGAGVEARALVEQLRLLDLDGYTIDFERVERAGIAAIAASVRTEEQHHNRHLSDIVGIINRSRLSDGVKQRAVRIFTRLAEAEARVHGTSIERVHFHEVGALDSIVDTVGACIGFELLGVERFSCSALHVGSGTIEMEHGRFPVPPPAVAELLRGAPLYATEVRGELVTPTGAAIVSTVCETFGQLPAMRLDATGYGAGSREYERFPNVLRVILGEAEETASADEKLLMVETNVDDASPQLLGHLMESVLTAGALDCYFTPAQMKKNRPGVLISILCRREERERVCEMLFAETTTLGVRFYEVERRALERQLVRVATEFGEIDVKVGRFRGRINVATPEYEQCRAAAAEAGVPLRIVEMAARAAFSRKMSEAVN